MKNDCGKKCKPKACYIKKKTNKNKKTVLCKEDFKRIRSIVKEEIDLAESNSQIQVIELIKVQNQIYLHILKFLQKH